MSRHPVIDRSTRLLVVAPHPDDESLAAGMLIQRVLGAGGRVDVLLLTDGDDNPWPQRWMERRLVIDAAARARWGARRRKEVGAALARLGVGPDHLHAFGWHDMQVTEELRLRHGQAVGAMRRVVERTRPNLVVIPDLGDTHPDHGSAHVLARLALAATGSTADVLTYMVHGTEQSAPEDLLVLDADPERQATKIQAVISGDVDFGICSPWEHDPELVFEPLFEDSFGVVFAPHHALARNEGELSWRDIDGYRIIGFSPDLGMQHQLSRTAGLSVEVREPRYRVSNTSTIETLVARGVGVSIMSALAAQRAPLDKLQLRLLSQPVLTRTVGVLRREGKSLSPAAATMLQYVRAAVPQLARFPGVRVDAALMGEAAPVKPARVKSDDTPRKA